MEDELSGNGPPTPQEKRRRGTEHRLRAALERLVAVTPNHPSVRNGRYRLTVSTLAREARVGRNTIYTNHRSILDELDRLTQQVNTGNLPVHDQKAAELSALVEQLQRGTLHLATENAALLKRAIDAEKMVERLKKRNAGLVRELTVAREPIVLSPRRA